MSSKKGVDPAAEALMEMFAEAVGKSKPSASKKEEEPAPPPAPFVAKEVEGMTLGQRLAELGIESNMPEGAFDPPITVYSVDDWSEEMQLHIPAIDPHRYVEWYPLAVLCLEAYNGGKVSMTGDPGTGKTSLAEFLCAITNQPFIRINYSAGVEGADVIGHMGIGAEGTEYIEGVLPRALRAGAWVHQDEWTRAPSGVMLAQQWLFERGGKLRLLGKHSDDMVTPDPRFRMSFADNTKGLGDNISAHGSSFVQDTSTINRFDAHLEIGYLPIEQEVGVLRSKFDAPEVEMRRLVQFANRIRTGYGQGNLSLTMSLRTLTSALEKGQYLGWKEGLRYAFMNSLPEDEKGVAAEQYQAVYGAKW